MPPKALAVPTSQRAWRDLFDEFLTNLRIDSKETVAEDERGSELEMWGSQRMFLDNICQGLDQGKREFLCLKARQLGVSTISLAILLFWLAMHPGLQAALVVDTEENREKFRLTIHRYIQSFPKKFFGGSFAIKKGKDNRAFTHFTNGSNLDYLVAGKRKKTLGESRAYNCALLTECANYGDPDGLNSFVNTLAQTHPDRLYLWESTAKGYNHWHDMWLEAGRDTLTKHRFFIGWWSKDINSYSPKGPAPQPALFRQYSQETLSREESEMIEAVKKRYGVTITQGQLAWYRHQQSNVSVREESMHQNLPWVEEQAFVLTGYSFFQTRVLQKDMSRIQGLEPGSEPVKFKGYRFWIGEDFFSSKMEQVRTVDEVELRIWEEPSKHGDYVIGCDPAFGRNDNKDRHCLDDETEVLTKEGWKRYEEINVGDEAVCFDLKTEKYSYGCISDVIVKDHDDAMYHFTSKGLDCLVTPEHRVVNRWYHLLRTGGKPAWRFKTAEELTSYGRSVAEFPVGGAPVGEGIDGLSLDVCRALGWILTDGYTQLAKGGKLRPNRRKRPSFVIAQSDFTVKAGINIASEMRDVIARLIPSAKIKRLPAKGRTTAQTNIYIGSKASAPLAKWFTSGLARIPRSILLDGSLPQLEALFQGILEGDGGWDKGNGNWTKVCPGLDLGFADDIQELAARLGYSPSIAFQKPGSKPNDKGQWIVRLSVRKAHTFEVPNVKRINYRGKVWCVTVPTGAFVARRNGKMFVTGNCVEVYRCYADKLVQVAEYAVDNVETRQAAWVLAYLAGSFRNCVVNLELTGGPGLAVLAEFNNLRNQLNAEMYSQRVKDLDWEDFLNNARWFLFHKSDSLSGAGYVAGWKTSRDNKFEIMNQLRDLHVTNVLILHSLPLTEEMLTFVQDGSELGALGTNKDDRVFASALAARGFIDWIRPKMLATNMTYARCQAAEDGTLQGDPGVVDRIVSDFFRRAEERAANGPEKPQWMVSRGLC